MVDKRGHMMTPTADELTLDKYEQMERELNEANRFLDRREKEVSVLEHSSS